jgi:hypothetical protein
LVSATAVGFGATGAAGEAFRASTDRMVTRGILVSVVTGVFGLGGEGWAAGAGWTVGAAGVGQGLAVGAHVEQGVEVVVQVVHGFAVVVQGFAFVQPSHLAEGRRYWRSRLHEEQVVHSRVRWAQANTSAEPSRRAPNLTGSGTRRMFDPH